jgi:phosphotransferase system HPr (HPr) family protein
METQRREFILTNATGLHARPAAALVRTAARYGARVEVVCGGRVADAKSLLSLLSLGAGHGSTIRIQAAGADADAALAAIAALIAGGFAEEATGG